MTGAGRRSGQDTKARIQEVALTLFTEQGYEATSMREIAERLHITKAALYYHFKNKEDIVVSLFGRQMAAVDDLIDWVADQPPGPGLPREVVERWVALSSELGVRLFRFAMANQHVLRELKPRREGAFERFQVLLDAITDPDAPVAEQLRTRVALLSVQMCLMAGRGLEATDDELTDAARALALELLGPPARPAAGTGAGAGAAGTGTGA
ncbi:TetR/AcrR family transcriptional regulator [Streptomyces sp. NPDC059853]|uniref:TetR/AcrR family transcriptional regulator n=1 Tax=Streptomyces sp. NPDC059853 TaxID=3346973 RepID=UPI00365375FB